MTANLKRRLDKLIKRAGLVGKPIVTYRMKPQHWARIKWNRNITVVLWYPDKNDHDRVERLADLERLKKCVSNLALLSQSMVEQFGRMGKVFRITAVVMCNV